MVQLFNRTFYGVNMHQEKKEMIDSKNSLHGDAFFDNSVPPSGGLQCTLQPFSRL